MKLEELANQLVLAEIAGDGLTSIHGISIDSRKVKEGDLFVCIRGTITDGHQYISEACLKGAAALVVEEAEAVPEDVDVPYILVPDSRYALSVLSAHFYDYPSEDLGVIGVTGTNGKTTITYLLEQILDKNGKNTGLMGTVEMKVGNQSFPVSNTTQESVEIQRSLAAMRDAGEQYVVMEVSSHGLDMGRVNGCRFRTAVFTNLTQDHLDYHQTMERYKEAKGRLFSGLGNQLERDPKRRSYAVLNNDDPASEYFKGITTAQVITYGIDGECDVKASELHIDASGTSFKLTSFAGEARVHLKMVGKFNVYNALAALTAALLEGVPLPLAIQAISEITGVPGRFESVHEGQPFTVLVDYAHTPDSLQNVLQTISQFVEGKVICVFGCGGDRDRGKRPLMGGIAAEFSDYCIITSDNPRTEDPERIIADIVTGIPDSKTKNQTYAVIPDRKQAIAQAVQLAEQGDVILIAGKGHETYQEIQGKRYDFDDREMAKIAIRSQNS